MEKVLYQKDEPEEAFEHKYSYSDRGQLTQVETRAGNTGNYTTQATYNYSRDGDLKRTVLGNNLQGIDYTYTLQGALKAINHPSLTRDNDPGGDDNDVFGMMIDYYNGDYLRDNQMRSLANTSVEDRYDGNIKSIRWKTKGQNAEESAYVYDYHSDTRWLKTAKFGHVSDNNFSYLTANPFLVDNITYDKNGNLLSLNRNQQSGQAMDRLTYHYKAGLNQLDHVTDGAGNQNLGDIGTQSVGNYSYNSIGQLEENQSEGVTYKYNTAGLTTLVEKDGKLRVGFSYDDKGQRVKKQSYNASGVLLSTTYYVRDASGTPMAIYTKTGNATKLSEVPVYGIQRLGVWNKEGNATKYELTDHLGNVRAVISEEKPTSLLAKTDYYPFGMAMPSRTLAGGYRYAYQGQELDPETGKEAFELRLWDSRLGRWLTPDPAGQFASPYLGMGNSPIISIDPDGGTCYSNGEAIACPQEFEQEYGAYGNNYDFGTLIDEVVFTFDRNQLDPSTVGRNLFGLTYPGGNNPITFSKLPDYTFVPEDLSEYPAIGHDRRYDNLGISGALGLLTDTRAIGADYKFASEELQIASNPFLPTKTRLYAGTLGVGLGLLALPKTLFMLSTPYSVQRTIMYYHISNHGVTNTPDKQ